MTIEEKEKLFPEEKQRIYMCQLVSVLICILGCIMGPTCYKNGNIFLTWVSIAYTLIFIVCFIHITFTKKLYLFKAFASVVIYALLFLYLKTGGTEGFGLTWLVLVPLVTTFVLTLKQFVLLNYSMLFLFIGALWTPLHTYCYSFTTTYRLRFPLLFALEVVFATFLMLRSRITDKEKLNLFNQLIESRETLKQKVDERTKDLEIEKNQSNKLMIETTTALAATVDAKDKYTSGHSLRVAKYSKQLAQMIGMNEKEQRDVYLMGLLHDIGKIGINDEIINKTSRLTDEEFELLKQHPEIGGNILTSITSMPEIYYGARWHHERFDGKGYPDKLQGNNIPIMAQIISVADSYDAMTSNRSYRSIMKQEDVRNEIVKGKGTQFNPLIADKMIELIDKDTEYKMHG